MTQDTFVQARRKKEAYRGTLTDGAVCRWHTSGTDRSGAESNADCADLDKSNVQVRNGQFLTPETELGQA